MANLHWIDEVRRHHAKHALPYAYIQRFVEELTDHSQDIMEEDMSTEANVYSRLGEPEQVADAAVTAYQRRSFLGRHLSAALLIFAISPIVSLLMLSVLVCVAMRLIGATAELFGLISNEALSTQPGPIALAITGYVFSLTTIVIPAIFASILYCRLAKRLGMGRKWMFVSCAVLAIVAMLPCWIVHAKIIDVTGHYAVQCCLWIPGFCGWIPQTTVPQLVQLLIPLAIGWWFMQRTRDQGRIQLVS
jgi:hypothetical protein